jgi:hypothetical protein
MMTVAYHPPRYLLYGGILFLPGQHIRKHQYRVHGTLDHRYSKLLQINMTYFASFVPPTPHRMRKLAQYGVLPSLSGDEWRRSCDFYCDLRSSPLSLKDCDPAHQELLSFKILAIPAAAATGITKYIKPCTRHL